MTQLIVGGTQDAKQTVTSLEVLEQINFFRLQERQVLISKGESITSNTGKIRQGLAELNHSDLCKLVREEFEEEILLGRLSQKSISSNGGRPLEVYELSLEEAKQLLVRESRFVRKAVIAYISSLEQALRSQQPKVPTNFREALLLAAEQQEVIEKQQAQLVEAAPKVDFYDQVVDSKDAIDMGSVAKVLNMGIGRNKLFHILREKKILMQDNKPYQHLIDSGYFRCIESKYTKPNGDTCINIKTVVYQKGIQYIRQRLTNKK